MFRGAVTKFGVFALPHVTSAQRLFTLLFPSPSSYPSYPNHGCDPKYVLKSSLLML